MTAVILIRFEKCPHLCSVDDHHAEKTLCSLHILKVKSDDTLDLVL